MQAIGLAGSKLLWWTLWTRSGGGRCKSIWQHYGLIRLCTCSKIRWSPTSCLAHCYWLTLRLGLVVRDVLGHQLGGDVLVGLPVLPLLEHRQVRVAIHAQPVLCIVDWYQVSDQLLVRLSDVPAFSLLRSEDKVVVERIVHDGEAEVLEVDPDLVHTPGEGSADNDAGDPVVAQPLKLCPALLAVRRHLWESRKATCSSFSSYSSCSSCSSCPPCTLQSCSWPPPQAGCTLSCPRGILLPPDRHILSAPAKEF